MKSRPSRGCCSDSGPYPYISSNLIQRSTKRSRRLVSTTGIVDNKILNSQVLHSGDLLGCCVFDYGDPEQNLRRFFRPLEEAFKCRNSSLVIERLALLNQRYIALAEGAGGNWYNLWTDLEDSKAALGGSTTDAKSQQGGGLLAKRSEGLVFFWVVLRNAATMVAVKLLSMYQTWTMYGRRNNQVLDVEKCQQMSNC
jgi:hypothetical protein